MNQGGRGVRLVPGLAVRAGQTIGRYRVEELLGAGASGVVISARNVHLRERVTLKILASYTDDQDELVQRRLAKARLASRLMSAHVARIVDIGLTDDGMPYVATEWLHGKTLETELEQRGRLEVEEAVRWMLEACEGLAEAHAAGLVHGDLKPQNILLAEPKKAGDPRVLKLLDFGTTSPLDAIADQSASAFFGSPAFLSPEQIQDAGSVDARADVWALGVLLYNLISGALPFEGDSVSGMIVAVVYDAPALLTDAPYELARIVSRCLEKDASKRPQDVKELAAALAPFAGSQGARLSERVRVMLETPPISDRSLDERPAFTDPSGSGSVSPVSVSTNGRDSEAPLLLVKKRASDRASGETPRLAKRDEPTRPSRRVAARRRKSRARRGSFALLGAAVVLALASWGTTRSTLPLVGETQGGVTEPAPELAAGRPTADVPPYVPTGAPRRGPLGAIGPGDLPDAPPSVSFAAMPGDGTTPTPLAMTPTPFASAAFIGPPAPARAHPPAAAGVAPRPIAPSALPYAPPRPLPPPAAKPTPHSHARPPTVLPPPRTTTAPPMRAETIKPRTPAGSRLPAGLPASREPVAPNGAAPARPAVRPGASAPPASRADETYVRKLFTDRK